jgi:transcriptional regulator with XRE-family HTH domain
VIGARPGGGPTVRRRILGAELRTLRQKAGLSRKEAGQAIHASESKISRLELGQAEFETDDLGTLLTLYRVEDQFAFKALAEEANQPDWWHQFGSAMPDWFPTYVGLEEAAGVIRTYEVQFVPGLLQTEDYARAVIAGGNGARSKEKLEHRLALRMGRQRLLDQDNPPRLWAVIDEAALRRPMGGPEVMRAQLEYLLVAGDRPGITIQVMPLRYGAHAAEGGAFTILRFPEPELPDIVYLEQLTGALYLDKREDVDQYAAAMERLCADSAAPRDSLFILQKIRKEL